MEPVGTGLSAGFKAVQPKEESEGVVGEIVISIVLALGLILGSHQLSKNNDQGPPPCQNGGSGCGFGGGGGGGF